MHALLITYIGHFENVLFQILSDSAQIQGIGMKSTKKLAKMTLTIALITSNTILMFTVPDLILIFNPGYSNNLFYVMNLCKVKGFHDHISCLWKRTLPLVILLFAICWMPIILKGRIRFYENFNSPKWREVVE